MEPGENKTVDVTRWNRKDRRRLQKQTKTKIPGRNLSYVKSVHKSWELYNKMRAEELKRDEELRNNAKSQANQEGEGIR